MQREQKPGFTMDLSHPLLYVYGRLLVYVILLEKLQLYIYIYI